MPDRLIRLRRGRPGPAAAGAESKYLQQRHDHWHARIRGAEGDCGQISKKMAFFHGWHGEC
jgi:hypothetical protein